MIKNRKNIHSIFSPVCVWGVRVWTCSLDTQLDLPVRPFSGELTSQASPHMSSVVFEVGLCRRLVRQFMLCFPSWQLVFWRSDNLNRTQVPPGKPLSKRWDETAVTLGSLWSCSAFEMRRSQRKMTFYWFAPGVHQVPALSKMPTSASVVDFRPNILLLQ